MSSILDALERASKERAVKQGQISSDAIGRQSAADRQSAIEKQLRNENEKQKKLVIRLAIVFGVVVVLAVGTMGYMMMAKGNRDAQQREEERLADAKASEPKTALQEIMPVLKSGLDAPERSAQSAASNAAVAPTPAPTAAPSPTDFPPPTAAPSPTVSTYIQNNPDALDVKSYKGVFTDGQIVRPAEVGWEVQGVMEVGSGNIAIVNNQRVKAGQKVGQLQITEIRSGLITADVGDGTIVKVRF